MIDLHKRQPNLSIETRRLNMRLPTLELGKLPISVGESIIFIPYEDILYIKSESNYSKIYTTKDSFYIVSKTLKKIESKLKLPSFVRVHASYVVNLQHLKSIKKSTTWYIKIGEAQIPVSRSRLDVLKTLLKI